ncbi:MAG TPA: chemotaxis protein CheX [Polyangia bacterium]|nr:chemotaxis protein CheX [Polyangia bacterium]
MSTKIPPDKLAALVSSVTETMCGLSFSNTGTHPALDESQWRTAALNIEGKKPIVVALSADLASCSAIGSAMFGCPADQIDAAMMEDVLRELVNMTAGQIKRVLALDDALGLPKMTTETDVLKAVDSPQSSNTPLSAGGVKLVLLVGPKNS